MSPSKGQQSYKRPPLAVVVDFSGKTELQNGLNLFFADTDEQLSSFAGLFYSDLKNFIKEMDVGNIVILLETPNDTKEVE